MKISNNIQKIKSTLSNHISLIAVSKTKPNSDLIEAYDSGQRIFGENKIQEMSEKWNSLPKDIKWHMIGHVQTNKVKHMASFVSLIHAVDSLKLIKEINKQALKNNRTIDCLIQIRIAEEETKFGLPENQLEDLLESAVAFPSVKIKGLMGMASFTSDDLKVRSEFKKLSKLFNKIKEKYSNLEILSMGMSDDYAIAIDEGSTMIRVGSKIFGNRN
jgi:pyridoxal phosphate enzyme (YggS family)